LLRSECSKATMLHSRTGAVRRFCQLG
jgi:hypothetical protein